MISRRQFIQRFAAAAAAVALGPLTGSSPSPAVAAVTQFPAAKPIEAGCGVLTEANNGVGRIVKSGRWELVAEGCTCVCHPDGTWVATWRFSASHPSYAGMYESIDLSKLSSAKKEFRKVSARVAKCLRRISKGQF